MTQGDFGSKNVPTKANRRGGKVAEGRGQPMKVNFKSILATPVLVAGLTAAGAAIAADYEVVDGGIPKPHVEGGGSADAGKAVIVDRKLGNCIACHAITALADQPFHGTVGPSLDGVGERYGEAQLRLIVTNSKLVFDGTVMPAFMKTDGFIRIGKGLEGKSILTAQQVEDVVAYLMTLKD